VWLVNIDAKATRKMGRKVPLSVAVPRPTLEELVEAAKALGLDPIAEPGKAKPSSWWHSSGRVLVKRGARKSELLKMLAQKVAELRRARRRA